MSSKSPSNGAGHSWLTLFLAMLVVVSRIAFVGAADEPSLYIVAPNDVLAITVYDQAQLSGQYMVQPDGTLTFPLLGRVKVGGLSVQAIEKELRDQLAHGYLKNPQVGVSVAQYRSQQIFVMGEVRQPGNLQFTGTMTLIEALARVGSTTDRAGTEAVVVRVLAGAPPPSTPATLERLGDAKDSEVIRVNLQSLQGGLLSQNVSLRAGDTIFIPRAASVFVSGQVRSPGEYTIRTGMTVRQILALAGGVTDRGSTRRMQIVRQRGGVEVTEDANLQDAVRSGDTIIVRERLF